MVYATMSALGECRAKWASNVSKVVIDVAYPEMSMHLTVHEARALMVDLTAALADAETTVTTDPAAGSVVRDGSDRAAAAA